MHFNGQKSSRVSEQLLLTSQSFWLKCKKRVAFVVFIKFKYKSLPTGLADLNKSQTLEIYLVDLFVLNITYFEILKNHQYNAFAGSGSILLMRGFLIFAKGK